MNDKLEIDVGKTGIEGLDELLAGGIPKGHVVLLEGASGAGKTVLSLQWLFEGWKKYQEPGIYIAITEPFTEVIKNASTLDFFDKEIINNGNIRFTDLRSMLDIMGLEEKEEIEKRI